MNEDEQAKQIIAWFREHQDAPDLFLATGRIAFLDRATKARKAKDLAAVEAVCESDQFYDLSARDEIKRRITATA